MNSRKQEKYRLEGVRKEVIAGVADISGYTKFMNISKETIHHSQGIINDLTNVIVNGIHAPFKINKIEGDGVFFYALKEDLVEGDLAKMSQNLLNIFEDFKNSLIRQSQTNYCECAACSNIHNLSLKTVVHSGEAFFYNIGGRFEELGGLDIVIAHRLLKNNIQHKNYLLVTDDAFEDLEFSEDVKFTDHMEIEPVVGPVNCELHVIDISKADRDVIAAKKLH